MGEDHAAPVLLYTGGGGPPRAELLRSILEGSGIEAYVRGAAMGSLYPTNDRSVRGYGR